MNMPKGYAGTVSERMERKWVADPATGCWNWQASRDGKGYGEIRIDGKNRRATHIALELAGKPRQADRPCALHRCDNPACVNPDHLWWGTMRENIHDMMGKGRQNLSGFALGRLPSLSIDESRPLVTCTGCGVDFRTTKARAASAKRHFCRRECCWSWQSAAYTGQPREAFKALAACGAPVGRVWQ